MIVYALWHGGSGYSSSDMGDLESFPSIRKAGEALWARAQRGGYSRQTFRYVNRAREYVFTPFADDGPSMWLYFADPTESRDPYPDRILTIGPRGGIRSEVA